MFCANCGAQVPDGTKFCPSCGKPCSTGEKVKQAAEDVFNKSEQELGNAFEDVKAEFPRRNGKYTSTIFRGQIKRGPFACYIHFTFTGYLRYIRLLFHLQIG